MEVISEGNAAQRVAAQGFTAVEIERLAEELLAALEHIHGAGILHRDLKPANVLIDRNGRFRLTDFGIAQPSDATSITQTGQVIGTMKYLAPEVRAGQPATARSDLYSLGVLLRECGADSAPPLAALVDALTQEDPKARPSSARGAAALLRVATAPTRVLPAPPPGEHGRRRSLILAAAGLFVIALVAVALAAGGDDDETPVDESPIPPATDTSRSEEPKSKPATQTEPEPEPAPQPEPQPQPTPVDCAQLEAQKRAIEEEKRAAEMAAGDDKESKNAIKEQFEEQKKAIEEQRKDCAP
jgi:serine/threonine-protein kinase